MRMRCVEESKYSSTIRTDLFVNDPAFLVVSIAFVVGLIRLLVERVADAFVEDLFGILWSIRTFRPRNRVMQSEFIQERREVVFVVLNVELLMLRLSQEGFRIESFT